MLLIDNILDVLAPHSCLGCDREGSLLCEQCSLDACSIVPSRCYSCKKLTPNFAVCEKCRKNSHLKHVWVCSEYSGLAKDLVYKLKFKGVRSGADEIAKLMAVSLPLLSDETVLVHIPTATSRKRQRGYDHTKLITQELSKILHLRHERSLGRVGQVRQVGANRAQRLKQLEGAYYMRKDVVGKSILLVDDIVTTGGSLEAAAKVLKEAGAKQVDAIVFAQKE